jgi:hypothetical protein
MGGLAADYGYSLKVDTAQNVYVTGFFQDIADFDPGVNTFNLTSKGMDDFYVMKLDSSGNLLWAEGFGGMYNDEGNSLTLDKSGNILITGGYFATIDFDPGTPVFNMVANGDYDIFILKLNTNGNFIWAKSIGGAYQDIGVYVTTDTSGNIYTTGTFSQKVDFDPGPGSHLLNSMNGRSTFISKLDGAGNFLFGKYFEGKTSNFGRALSVDRSGNIFTTGYFSDSCDFDPGPGVMEMSTSTSNYNVYIQKMIPCKPDYAAVTLSICDSQAINGQMFNTSGVYYQTLANRNGCDSFITLNLTIKHISTIVNRSGSALTATEAGAKYQWVQCPSYALLPADTMQSFTATNTGNYAVIISSGVCKDTSSCYAVNGMGIAGKSPIDVAIFPNPFADQFTITINKNIMMEIYNSLGALIYKDNLKAGHNMIRFTSEPRGLYIVKLFDENGLMEERKIIKTN